ncbi:hypothetical protein BD414DRAFT_551359 [Trametes punicea]|nr:hypothetical protein BD414DRAFT_551359 [Trametes punicea]
MWWPTISDNVSQDSTVGVYVLGTILTAMLYGLTFLQNLQYFDRYRNDCIAVKFFILVLWLFDSTTMVLSMQAVYIFAVARRNIAFAEVEVLRRSYMAPCVCTSLEHSCTTLNSSVTVGARYWYISGFIGECRLPHELTRNRLRLINFNSSAYGIANSHPAYIDGLSVASAALQIATDVMINIALYWLCSRCKRNHSRGVVRDSLVDLVNRGVVSTLLQLLTTITYFALRPRLVWMSFHMASSKVHALSLLSTMNSRDIIEGVGLDVEVADAQLRYRVERELRGASFPERPPIIPSIRQLRSQSSWFANGAKSAEAGDNSKSATAMTTFSKATGPGSFFDSTSASISALSRGASVHARSITAVDGACYLAVVSRRVAC